MVGDSLLVPYCLGLLLLFPLWAKLRATRGRFCSLVRNEFSYSFFFVNFIFSIINSYIVIVIVYIVIVIVFHFRLHIVNPFCLEKQNSAEATRLKISAA